jgi:drug/metabolite transporter (DMT)-like permease
MPESRLDWKAISVLILLSLIWGGNMASIKIGTQDFAPLFMAGVRSAVAAFCLWVWMRVTGMKVFPSKAVLWHGVLVGILFGTEFGFIYVGVKNTLVSRAYLLIYSAPFFVALGAHFFLADDRLNRHKAAGLVLAFIGVGILFIRDFSQITSGIYLGDILALIGGALWGATTILVKRFLAHRTHPLQMIFYQLFFSAPLLFLLSWIGEPQAIIGVSWSGLFSLFYQTIIVAFLSYLTWGHLIHRYPVSLLHAFSFFTPLFGVFLSGVIIMGEPLGVRLLIALALLCLGMVLVNYTPKAKA